MIPSNRPVIGADLLDLRERLQLKSQDIAWLLGLSMTKWMMIVNKDRNQPVKDPTLALVVRVLDEFPELNPIPRAPSAAEIMSLADAEIPKSSDEQEFPLTKKKLSILFGAEASSGYRWLETDSGISPVLGRLFSLFQRGNSMAGSRAAFNQRWVDRVETEARARGISEIFRWGRWVPSTKPMPKRRPRRSPAEKAAAEAAKREAIEARKKARADAQAAKEAAKRGKKKPRAVKKK